MKALPIALAAAFTLCAQPSAAGVVISEFYASGGKANALYDRDYVVLRNVDSGAVNLDGWSFQHYKTGQGWKVLPLTQIVVAARGTFLIQLYYDQGTAEGAPIPDVDLVAPQNSDWNLSTTNGEALAIVDGVSALTSCSAGNVVDLVGYNAGAPCGEGGTFAPTTTISESSQRLAGGTQDTDDNAADFALATPLTAVRLDAGAPPPGPDAATPGPDAAAPGPDAAPAGPDAAPLSLPDAAQAPPDAAPPGPDAGADAAAPADASVLGADATAPADDAASPPSDAAVPADGSQASTEDAEVRSDAAADPEGAVALEVGCGCGSASGAAAVWVLLGAVGAARRRRR